MGRFFALFVLLLVAACAGMAPKVEGVRTIGIVSAVGDKFYLRKVGFTVFGNESQEMAIDSWGIDELMSSKIRAALAGRFDVRPVKYRRAAFAEAENRLAIGVEPLRGETVRAEVTPQGLDAYLIVTKASAPYGQTNQMLTGLGIVDGFKFGDHLVYVYTFYSISLVNGHDWTVSRGTFATVPGEPSLFGPRLKGASRELDASWWPASLDATSSQRLKGVVAELIDQSLPGTLQKMQMMQ
jgi:hypothetical protein